MDINYRNEENKVKMRATLQTLSRVTAVKPDGTRLTELSVKHTRLTAARSLPLAQKQHETSENTTSNTRWTTELLDDSPRNLKKRALHSPQVKNTGPERSVVKISKHKNIIWALFQKRFRTFSLCLEHDGKECSINSHITKKKCRMFWTFKDNSEIIFSQLIVTVDKTFLYFC